MIRVPPHRHHGLHRHHPPRPVHRAALRRTLLLGVLVVGVLLVISLFTGVYDIAGADDGAEMFQITRVPRTIALVLSARRWRWQAS